LTAKVNEGDLKSGSLVHSRMSKRGIIEKYKITEISPDGPKILEELLGSGEGILKGYSEKEVRLAVNPKKAEAAIRAVAGKNADKVLSVLRQSVEARNEVFILADEVDVKALITEGRSTERELLATLREGYSVDNPVQKQYSRSAGITFLAPDMVSVLTKVSESSAVRGRLKDFHLRFLYDILYPIVMGSTNDRNNTTEKLAIQARDRAVDEGARNKEDDLYAFYKEIDRLRREGSGGDPLSFQPYSRSEVSFFMAGPSSKIIEQGNKYKEMVMGKDANAAQLSSADPADIKPEAKARHTGGIDLTTTAEKTRLRSLSGSLGSATFDQALKMLGNFKGFEFQVIQYQPISNPAAFFTGPSLQTSGPWFLSKAPFKEGYDMALLHDGCQKKSSFQS